MLNSFAYDIYTLNPIAAICVTMGLVGLGGFLHACLHRPVAPLARSRFFLLSGFVGVLASVALLAPLLLPWVISTGMLFALLVLQSTLAVVVGAAFYPIAAGRALDAFDNPRFAALAYIPFCSIVLLVKSRARSRRGISASAPPRTSTTLNILVGLFLALLVLAITVKAFQGYAVMDQVIASNPDLRRQFARGHMGAGGLEAMVDAVARDRRQVLPLRLNEHLVLTDVVADGPRLILTIAVDPPDLRAARMIEFGLPNGVVRDVMVERYCEDRDTVPLFEAGAVFVLVFTTESDGELGRLVLAEAECAETQTPSDEPPRPGVDAEAPGEEI